MLNSRLTTSRSQRILVTGGAGFIGSHLVDALISRGCKVTILDNLSTGTLKNIEPHLNSGNAKLIEGDVRNIREVVESLRKVETVFHLAAITSVPYSVENPAITSEVNAEGTRNLLEASTSGDIENFVLVSSCAVYGEPQYLPIDEEHPLNPYSPYAESKVRAESYCREFHDRYGLKTVTLRLFNAYGLRQSDNEYSGVITKFIKNMQENRPLIIYGDGQQERDFIHVSDVVQALLLSINNDKAAGHIFNVGTGKSVKINDLSRLLRRKFNSEVEILLEEPRSGDIIHSRANIEKAKKILRYKPRVPLEKGIEDLTKQWTHKPG